MSDAGPSLRESPVEESSQAAAGEAGGSSLINRAGLIVAPAVAVLIYLLLPQETRNDAGEIIGGLSHSGRIVASVGALMAILWITEATPIPATALLPIGLFPVLTLGDVSVAEATAPYAHPLIFLFMGGFMIALAMERWELHRRVALATVMLFGTRPTSVIAGFMVASAALSMWVSNTATTVMMLPIALSVIGLVRRELRERKASELPEPGQPFPFAICLLLGVAYGASIGGVATLIGTPPNTFLAAYLRDDHNFEITFASWLPVGLSVTVVFLPIAWLVLTRIVFPIHLSEIPGGRELIRQQLRELGPISSPERRVMIVFLVTAALWILRGRLSEAPFLSGLNDSSIAIGAALVLFAWPVDWRRGVFLLSWAQARRLPWGILLLFGGGLSLAAAVEESGVASFIANGVTGLQGMPTILIVLVVTALIIFLTELTSNTATTATFVPILGAIAIGLDVSPLVLCVPAALAASCAFMMPVATPPNAIVFGSGEITIPQMVKAGIWLNLIGIVIILAVTYWVAMPLLVE